MWQGGGWQWLLPSWLRLPELSRGTGNLLFYWNSQKSSILVLYYLKRFQESHLTLFNCRLLLIKHLLIKRSGLGWASLALLGLEDLAVIEQLKNMRRRLGESNPADVHSNQNFEVLCRRYISCGYPNDLAATVLMPWSKPVLLLPEDETTLAFNLDTPSSHTFPATILTAHGKKTPCLIRSAIITQ